MKRNHLLIRIPITVVISILLLIAALSGVAFANEQNANGQSYAITNVRTAACNRMYNMSVVEWTLDSDLYYAKTISGGKFTSPVHLAAYDANHNKIVRKGIPYSQIYREFSSAATPYALRLGERDPQVVEGHTCYAVKGVDCSSAVSFAWRYGVREENSAAYNDNFMKRTNTSTGEKSIYDGSSLFLDALNNSAVTYKKASTTYKTGTYVTKVGDYGSYKKYYMSDGEITTINDIPLLISKLTANGNYADGKDIWSEVYAKIQPGDALVCPSHVRLVTDVNIVKNADGSIDENASTIEFIGQIGTNFNMTTPNAITSWENKSQKFSTLLNANYLPVKMNQTYNPE